MYLLRLAQLEIFSNEITILSKNHKSLFISNLSQSNPFLDNSMLRCVSDRESEVRNAAIINDKNYPIILVAHINIIYDTNCT